MGSLRGGGPQGAKIDKIFFLFFSFFLFRCINQYLVCYKKVFYMLLNIFYLIFFILLKLKISISIIFVEFLSMFLALNTEE